MMSRTKAFSAIVALAVMAGCQPATDLHEESPDIHEPLFGRVEPVYSANLRTIVWGMPAEDALTDRRKFIQAVEGFDVPRNGRPLHTWIDEIISYADNPGIDGNLSGLGGAPAHAFLALGLRATAGGAFNPVKHRTRGQITHYFFDRFEKYPGWDWYLVVEMVTERILNKNVLPVRSYRYTVRVAEDGVQVIPRSGPPDNVFPGTKLAISADAARNKDGVPYQFKLYAEGNQPAQDNIMIEKVEMRTAGGAWNELAPNHPLYRVFDSSCIDMMFINEPPEELTGIGPGGLGYCLGRCQSPPLVNTM